jgi:hypothetical protein
MLTGTEVTTPGQASAASVLAAVNGGRLTTTRRLPDTAGGRGNPGIGDPGRQPFPGVNPTGYARYEGAL